MNTPHAYHKAAQAERWTSTMVLLGHVPSKKNTWQRGKSGMYIPSEVKAEIYGLILQAKAQWQQPPMDQASVTINFIVPDGRADLDNKLTCVLDVLVKAGVLRNDSIAHLQEIRATAGVFPDERERCTVRLR